MGETSEGGQDFMSCSADDDDDDDDMVGHLDIDGSLKELGWGMCTWLRKWTSGGSYEHVVNLRVA
jgi:hypothetical protein